LSLFFRHFTQPERAGRSCWHGARNISLRAQAHHFKPSQPPYTLLEPIMKIENLSKDLDTTAMTEVTGGTALTGQVVPTNVQSNALEQAFNIKANGPVAIANDADQSNDSDQDTFSPVGSILAIPTLRGLIR
jgi:hypothetical protein